MTTKEYVDEIKKMVFALQHHIYKTECFCESCAGCRMYLVCQQLIKFEQLIRVLENYA